MLRIPTALALAFGLLGCAGGSKQPARAAPAAPAALASSPTAPASATPVAERAELRRFFDEEHVTGTLALYDSVDGKLFCTDVKKCGAPYVPASTFKIANAVIALETGVASDPETKLPWDGKEYTVAAWNQDHTLRSAIQSSCVPCFQAIARNVGQPRMDEWLERLGYGNRDTSGGIDRFWLSGGLRISALEQVDFLRRLEQGRLPIQPTTRDFVLDMLALDVADGHVLRGKTGLARAPDEAMNAGWFVGWVELGARRVFFALVLDGFAPDVDPALRRVITERILRELTVL